MNSFGKFTYFLISPPFAKTKEPFGDKLKVAISGLIDELNGKERPKFKGFHLPQEMIEKPQTLTKLPFYKRAFNFFDSLFDLDNK